MARPFRPGFGTAPTVLAGREHLADSLFDAVVNDAPIQRAVVGPRGVGKTVLLRSIEQRIDATGAIAVWHACDSRQATAEILARTIIDTTRRMAPWWDSFGNDLASRLSIGVDAVAQINLSPRPSEEFHPDSILTVTVEALGRAARQARTQVVVLLDEIQSLQGSHELVRVSQAMDLTNGRGHPVSFLVAGLHLPESPSGGGGTFIERLQDHHLAHLSREATAYAFTAPLALNDVGITSDALEYLVNKSQGYPYFVQLYGDAAWERWSEDASGPITKPIALEGVARAERKVDSMYRGRFDRLGPLQQRIVVVAGRLADQYGAFRMRDVATALDRSMGALSTARASLIERHQLIEPTGTRGQLRFVLPEYHSWAATRGAARLEPDA